MDSGHVKDVSVHSEPHVTPLWIYLGVGTALLFLTVITVAVAYIDLGPFNLVVAMTIATLKASLVCLFFMHLLYDHKFYMYAFLLSLVFLAIFITFTLFDTLRRGDLYPEVGGPIEMQAAHIIKLQQFGGSPSHDAHGTSTEAHTPTATPSTPSAAAPVDSMAHAGADSTAAPADTAKSTSHH